MSNYSMLSICGRCTRQFKIGSYNTRHKSLKQKPFVLNFLRISYIHSSHLCSQSNVPLSFPNVEPRVFWSTEMTANPKSTLGRGKSHKCFKICDEYCSGDFFSQRIEWRPKQIALIHFLEN